MLVKPTAAKVKDDEKCERAMQWPTVHFGFHNCPIIRKEILGVEGNEVVFSPLRCYIKTEANHSGSEQQAVRAASRCAGPKRAIAANRVDLENEENKRDWRGKALVRADGGAGHSRR